MCVPHSCLGHRVINPTQIYPSAEWLCIEKSVGLAPRVLCRWSKPRQCLCPSWFLSAYPAQGTDMREARSAVIALELPAWCSPVITLRPFLPPAVALLSLTLCVASPAWFMTFMYVDTTCVSGGLDCSLPSLLNNKCHFQ